jgi:acetylornithine deacetylase/succinyl-diaminopimelate desuccinylase-like protein
MNEELEKVFKYIDKNSEEYVEQLRRLCRQESISTQNKGIEDCANLVLKMMKEIGVDAMLSRVKGSNPAVIGILKSKKENVSSILFYNHYDVQPPEPFEEWESEPFSAEIRDNKIYARGVADNKGNLVARLMAIKAYQETLGDIPVDLKFLVEGEEEIGGKNLARIAEENKDLLKADGCLMEGGTLKMDGTPEMAFGAKGILYIELRVKVAEKDQHSSLAPFIPNAAWKLIWALNTIKDRDGKIKINGFYDNALEPDKDDLNLLEKLSINEEYYHKLYGVKERLRLRKGTEAGKVLLFSPTCTICGISSGYIEKGMKTVNPCYSYAKVDFRLVPNQKSDEILNKIRRHLDKQGFKDVEVIKLGSYEPARSPIYTKISKVVIKTAKQIYGAEPLLWPLTAGSAPVSVIIEGLKTPLAGGECLVRDDSNVHAPNENVRISDYIKAIKHLVTIFLNCAKV